MTTSGRREPVCWHGAAAGQGDAAAAGARGWQLGGGVSGVRTPGSLPAEPGVRASSYPPLFTGFGHCSETRTHRCGGMDRDPFLSS